MIDYEDNDEQDGKQPGHERPSALRVIHDRKPTTNIIAGRNPVMEALKAGTIIEKVVILSGVKGTIIEKIQAMAKRNRVPCVEVGKQKFRDLVSDTTTQGVVAIVGTKAYVEVSDILGVAKQRNEKPFILILDEIEDPQNLGALLRTAECAGVHGAIIPKHHAATVNQTVAKTSAGASEHIPVAKVTNIATTLEELKKEGVWIVGAAADGDRMYDSVDYTMPVAIVIGNEGKGIRHLVKERCDFLVKIPLFGKVESLNASVAGALVMYEAVRKRKQA
jgi:23S rRNA (guanosine2251-2'-O)-methyltransferase